MHDNGLMEYYRSFANKQGYLKTSEIPGFKVYADRKYQEHLETPSHLYFAKTGQKDKIDAEVLLSQIYKNAGFDTAIYTPILNSQGARMVASNNIATATSDEALKLVEDMRGFSPTQVQKNLGFIPQKTEGSVIEKYFTPSALTTLIELYGFDVAAKNYDRNLLNFFVDSSREDGLIDNIGVFDFGQSGCAFTGIVSGIQDESKLPYRNVFADGTTKTRGEILEQFKTNETVLTYTSPNTIAEKIGSVDVVATATDIKQSIGYEINPQYVDFVASSFNTFANDLVK